jgi:hypothetical protein
MNKVRFVAWGTVLGLAAFAVWIRDREQRQVLSQAIAAMHVASPTAAPIDAAHVTVAIPTGWGSVVEEDVADRVAAKLVERIGAKAAVSEEPAPEPRTQVQEEARNNADRLLEAAVASGRLRVEDVRAIRSQLATARASREEHFEFARRIAVAVNEQRLTIEDPYYLLP